MSQAIAFAAVKLGMENKNTSGLLFYGGEPLLEKNLIYDIASYTKALKKKTSHHFYYKMTTNGILLDEEFLKFSQEINLAIGFSHDGPAQDDCRVFPGGRSTYDILDDKIPLLLKYQPYSIGMSVIDPSTVHKASAIVNFLFEKGFKYITINLNYNRAAPWTKKHLSILEKEYRIMADMYVNWIKAEEKFYLSPFDIKILSHLKGETYHADRRQMAKNQPSVAPDGKIYASSRFLGNPAFEIGDVFSGIDFKKQSVIFEKGGVIPDSCKACALISRCNYVYDSLCQSQEEGQEAELLADIAPIQCAHERLITPIADYAAQKLYKEHNALFMHKHYNELYPIMSLIEDRSKKLHSTSEMPKGLNAASK